MTNRKVKYTVVELNILTDKVTVLGKFYDDIAEADKMLMQAIKAKKEQIKNEEKYICLYYQLKANGLVIADVRVANK